jgi:hypothetical protein
MPIRAAVYFDGFNMYHALDALRQPMLKWLDLWAVSQRLISADEDLVRVVTCTAAITDNVPKMLRHRAYISALEGRNVDCLQGHFIEDKRRCNECGDEYVTRIEKQGDVNLALAVIDDAHRDVYDHCYLVTADGDQVATARMLKARFPDKRLFSVAPPGKQHNKMLLGHSSGHRTIKVSELQLCLLGATVQGREKLILRPQAYAP